jgi:GTP-binding protein
MKILSAEFITSVTALNQVPVSKLPEVAFIGRSNVGKSSLINSLCNRKSLAKTSSQPGKTRVINFYRINNTLNFVDLPGYGYAKVPDEIRSGWQHLIEGFLKNRSNLKLGIVVIDARHEPTRLDHTMINWLDYYGIPYGLILTKSDKIPRHKLQLRVAEVKKSIFRENEYCKAVLPYSSISGEGKREVMMLIEQALTNDTTTNPLNK